MPPHCDSMDGPVVKAAKAALASGDVRLILPYVPKEGEAEVSTAFDKVLAARAAGGAAADVADLYFFETVVRIHRAGEGAAFTGLKPAGLSEGPVIPLAEAAVESGSADELIEFLSGNLRSRVEKKLEMVTRLEAHEAGNVDEAREYVEAMLGFIVRAHKLYDCMLTEPHEAHRQHGVD